MSCPSPFPETAEAQWRAVVERALGGAPFDALIAKTYDDIAIAPLYPAASDEGVRPLRAQTGPWRLLMRVDHPDPGLAFSQARADLAEGADGISLIFSGSPCAFGFGLADFSHEAAERFYAEVEAPLGATLELACPPLEPAAAANFIQIWIESGRGSRWRPPSFVLDPALVDPAKVAATALARRARITNCFCADGRRVHAAGGSEAQELAFALAGGARVLRGFEAVGASLDAARGLLSFRLAADADFFLTIAKFRALRLLWQRVETACGLAPKPIQIQAETAWRMMTRRDCWTNALRAGAAAAAAALGGADEIVVLPFTQALGLPDAGARRLARNAQLVLLHEAHLAKVADPAGGAGAFERLTEQVCVRAWRCFQGIERVGGLAAALAKNLVQSEVARTLAARKSRVARRFETIVGTSDYPDLAERPVATLAAPRSGRALYAGLPLVRLAEPFERLRDRSDAQLAATGARPLILLAALGAAAASRRSVTVAKALFEAGGLETTVREGLAGAQEAAEAFAGSAARIACLCPGPDVPEELVLGAARALAGARARLIYVSGEPSISAAALRETGVMDVVYPGCDALSILRRAQTCAA